MELGLNTPHVMDSSGLWIKRNGTLESNLLCGMLPLSDNSKDLSEEEYYNNLILPSIKNRLSNCDITKVSIYILKNQYKTNYHIFKILPLFQIKCVNTEVEDCNTYDDTGILGPHPYHNNLYIAAGFGRLGKST